jgi:hypothetical protein
LATSLRSSMCSSSACCGDCRLVLPFGCPAIAGHQTNASIL